LELSGRKWERRGWRRLHDELHNLYASTNISRVIKSRRIRWARHMAHMGEMKNAYDLKGQDHLEGLGIEGEVL
jgi:hypothetical protein